jgi:hypothetical protein
MKWSADDLADRLLGVFEKGVRHRSVEDMEDVLARFAKMAEEFIGERRDEKSRIRINGS